MSPSSNLVDILKEAISRPPSKVDLRLKPEEELARILGVGRRRLRNSLAVLEQEGFLARRRGSGTYVRRVPEAASRAEFASKSILDEKLKLAPEQFFVDSPDSSKQWLKPIGPSRSQKVLHLQLWKDLHSSPTVSQAIVDGMITQASELSHRLTIHSFFARKDTPLTPQELRQKMAENACDGYIVASRWSDQFTEARTSSDTPAIFYSSSRRSIKHEPHLMLDTAEAVERSVRLLAEAGHQRIGVMAISAPGHIGYFDQDAYERTMAHLNLKCHAFASSERDVNKSIDATLTLLDRSAPLEALYVSDNFLLDGVVAALKIKNLTPGKDIAIITHSNAEHELPGQFNWSRIEFDLHEFGHRLVNELLREIQRADAKPTNLAVMGKWRKGNTHLHPLA